MCFADDLAICTDNLSQLELAIDLILEWSAVNRIEVNKAKSGIFALRKDNRTKMPIITDIRGIKLVSEYKFLGVKLTDSANIKLFKKDTNDKLRQFKF